MIEQSVTVYKPKWKRRLFLCVEQRLFQEQWQQKQWQQRQRQEREDYQGQNGLVLGGVESWTYDLAGILKEIGWKGMYLTTDLSESAVADDTYPVYTLPYNRFERDKDRI